MSYEANQTWFNIILNIPTIIPNSECLVDKDADGKNIELLSTGEGPIFFYGLLQPTNREKWEILDRNRNPVLQFKEPLANPDFISGPATSFGNLFSYNKLNTYIKYTLFASIAMLIVTLLLFIITVLKV